MPSSLNRGPFFRFMNVVRTLTVKSGGRFVIEDAAAAPASPVRGTMYVTAAGVLMIYNGSGWVAVGSQT